MPKIPYNMAFPVVPWVKDNLDGTYSTEAFSLFMVQLTFMILCYRVIYGLSCDLWGMA